MDKLLDILLWGTVVGGIVVFGALIAFGGLSGISLN